MDTASKKKFQVTEEILATMPQRFLNYLIDGIMQLLLFMVSAFVALVIGDSLGSKKVVNFMAGLDKNTIALYTVTIALVLIYYNFFEILFARTIGKFITQTVVVDEHGEKPHHDSILIRSLCRFIPFNPLSVLFSSGRGWHDSLSKTYVVDKRKLDESTRIFYSLQRTENEG
jgi:uncharacterized RDD family membrane protein YckC